MEPELRIDSAASLASAYHRLIPISKAMGIAVKDYDGARLTLTAPLAANVNHQMSAFGGSLFSLAALAGWGLLQLKLTELRLDCNTVIAGGNVAYKRPVFADFDCICELPPDWDTIAAGLAASGRASLELTPWITVADETAMTFSGKYVINFKRSAAP